eukprot:scaffold104789_cov21-Tisochrysis_lutea.AAC.1
MYTLPVKFAVCMPGERRHQLISGNKIPGEAYNVAGLGSNVISNHMCKVLGEAYSVAGLGSEVRAE